MTSEHDPLCELGKPYSEHTHPHECNFPGRANVTSNCLELSQAEIDALVIAELQRRHPRALPISIDYEPRTDGGFCHCWWVPYENRKEVHPGL